MLSTLIKGAFPKKGSLFIINQSAPKQTKFVAKKQNKFCGSLGVQNCDAPFFGNAPLIKVYAKQFI
ncbi:MAG: hypothetical protein DRR00_28455 [Candidatus Parabeggiatoa sp. nov. 3]|nr:MAG: hypothetical protein DRR00_28455 [Gammaproteobacteria bacterium]RKZ56466.1 MAG: hypothetical protein DRQ99_28455 [Gammaproteobacteria bacterium]